LLRAAPIGTPALRIAATRLGGAAARQMKRVHLPLVSYLTLRRYSRETTEFGGIPSKAPIREIAKFRRNPAFQRLAFGVRGKLWRFHRLQLCQQGVGSGHRTNL
jgi:hypothetical protein